jgi:periplasmic protein TonB
MNNAIALSAEFERQKNIKAFSYTAAIMGGLLVIFLFAKMTLPPKEIPQEEQYVEIALPDEPPVDDVNLGNNDVGSGKVQPIVTGTPSSNPPAPQVSPSPVRSVSSQVATKDVETEEHPSSPPVTKATVPNTNKEINNNPTDQTVKTKPVEAKPRAIMTSTRGSGNGGNTDVPGYNKPGGQGPGDGAGDKGVQNGNPNGTRYLGVRVISIPNQNFEDDFNESGKIALDVQVDGGGRLVSATYQAKGSTLARSSKQYSIALDRARQIKYPQYEGGFKQTLTFNFTVK